MKRKYSLNCTIIFILALGASLMFTAQSAAAEKRAGQAGVKPYFAGFNLLSPFPSFLPVPGNTLFSVLSNLECGLGLSGGMIMNNCHAFELRLALGPNSRSETIFHSQIYYNFFLIRRLNLRMKGLYTGGGLRYWDLYNDLTGVHRNNIAGQIDAGYRFRVKGPAYIDLRTSEIVAVYSWLSADHTTGGWATLAEGSVVQRRFRHTILRCATRESGSAA